MSLKALIRQIAPPILLDLYRRVRGPRYVWKGVYDSFADVPASGDGFASEAAYVRPLVHSAKEMMAATRRNRFVPTEVFNYDAYLPFLASAIRPRVAGRLCILDFGGGLGTSYVHVLSSAVSCAEVDYHVVELAWACREGPRLFEGNERVHFHRELPASLPGVDIVYALSSLSYVEDYRATLRRLCSHGARYLLFVDVPVGMFKTFASSVTNIGEASIPHWFFNADELVDLFASERYRLVFKAAMETQDRQDNFPPEFRLDEERCCILLFENLDPDPPGGPINPAGLPAEQEH